MLSPCKHFLNTHFSLESKAVNRCTWEAHSAGCCSLVSYRFLISDFVIAKDWSCHHKFRVREVKWVECQAAWGVTGSPKYYLLQSHPRECKYMVWQQNLMQAKTWCVEQRNPLQGSERFCLSGGEWRGKDVQQNRGCPCVCVCNGCWILMQSQDKLFKNYSDCFDVLFSSSFILPSWLKQCLPLRPVGQNLCSHTLWIGTDREINKDYILNHPGIFCALGK